MTTKEIANRLVALCREGKFEETIKELYSKDAESIEPASAAAQGWDTHIKGLDKFAEKGEKWRGMTEAFHGITVTDPIVMGNRVALGMTMDVTMKGMPRNKFEQIAVYELANGKIVKEQFFY